MTCICSGYCQCSSFRNQCCNVHGVYEFIGLFLIAGMNNKASEASYFICEIWVQR